MLILAAAVSGSLWWWLRTAEFPSRPSTRAAVGERDESAHRNGVSEVFAPTTQQASGSVETSIQEFRPPVHTSPEELIGQAPSATMAITRLRSVTPSKDVVDALSAMLIACKDSARSISKRNPEQVRSEEQRQRHQNQLREFLAWCGDIDAVQRAYAESGRQARLTAFDVSEQARAAALLDANGPLPPERQAAALALLKETNSLPIADAIAQALYLTTYAPSLEGMSRNHIENEVRPWRAIQLASAMVICRKRFLCGPNHPRTVLDCASTGLCAPGQRLIDYRNSLANTFERELAEQLVAEWSLRWNVPPGG